MLLYTVQKDFQTNNRTYSSIEKSKGINNFSDLKKSTENRFHVLHHCSKIIFFVNILTIVAR